MKISWTVLSNGADAILIGKFSKGPNSINVDGVTVLFLCTSSDCDLYLYKVS